MKKLLLILFVFFSIIYQCIAQDSTALHFESTYTSDIAAFTDKNNNFKTGILGELDISMEINTENAGWWKNGTFMVYLLNNHGSMPTTNTVGDFQTFSNIEASPRTKLYELWYQHEVGDLIIKLGQQNVNNEYVFSEYGLNLINSSFGVIPTVSGNQPISIFPNTSLGVNLIYELSPIWKIQSVITDGNPGDEDSDPFGTEYSLSKEDGNISISEIHRTILDPETGRNNATLKFGYWNAHNSNTNNYGLYTINDFVISRNANNQDLGWRGFVQAGISPESEIEKSFGCGLTLLGVQNTEDVFAIGYTNAIYSKESQAENNFATGEHVIETSYAINIHSNITFQPDIQYIINTGGEKNKNSITAMLRVAVNLDN